MNHLDYKIYPITVFLQVLIIKRFKFKINLRYRMYGNLMSFTVHFLHGGVVSILVRDKEGSLDVAPIRILAVTVEDLLVQFDVVVIDSVVESDRYHLGDVLRW